MTLLSLLLILSCLGFMVRGCGACAQTIWLYKNLAVGSVLLWLLCNTVLLMRNFFF